LADINDTSPSGGTAIIPFDFEGRSVRVVPRDGEPWFVAADVCSALGLTNSRMALQALDEDEKGVSSTYTPGGPQQTAIVSESGLYTLILRSRDATKPGTVAHRFRKWVTSEVLPAIRKHGGYMVAAPEETPEELMARALRVADAAVARLKAENAVLTPKAAALDRLATADGTFSITESAKAIQVRPKDLFNWLSQNGWTYRRAGSGNLLGYQTRVQSGDLEHKVTTVLRADGSEKITEQVRITPKGLAKLAKLVPGAVVAQEELA
jgi:prophage antirepressor-like protein